MKTQSKDNHPQTQNTSSQNPNQNVEENQSVQKNKGPETFKQNYAAAIWNQNHKKSRIKLPPRAHEIVQDKPVVIFTKEEHDILTDTCRWTIFGKFSRTRPAIDIIRAEFNNIIQLKCTVKIGAFDLKHVFIDVEYEEDYESLSSRNYIHLEEDCIMQLQKWTPFFKPAKRNSISPVWITLPDLSWQFFEWMPYVEL